MRINYEKLIKEVYHKNRSAFPGVTEEEFTKIAKIPIKFIATHFRTNLFPIIKLKYIGTFFVPPNRLIRRLKFLNVSSKTKHMTEEEKEEYREVLEDGLRKINNHPFISGEKPGFIITE